MQSLPRATLVTVLAAALAACASTSPPTAAPAASAGSAAPAHTASTAKQATANLASASGSLVSGRLTLVPMGNGVHITGEIGGLQANSSHGFHIHEKGDCGNNGNASGGHFNPAGGMHGKFGGAGTHAGELPSLVADAAGVARFSVDVHSISLTDGAANNVVGRALVVHRDRDDFSTQPAGNSGPRIACAVITRE